VNGRYAVYGRFTPRGQDVFLYDIAKKTTRRIPRTIFAQYNPSVTSDGTVFYGRSGEECGSSSRFVRFPRGGPARVLYRFQAGIDVGYGYVDERATGTLDVLYGRLICRNSRWDIYKLIDSHTVTITTDGIGSGTVTSDPAGVSCGSDCEQIYHGGTEVTFTATEDAGSTFVTWSSPCGTERTCSVSVEGDVSLTATFDTAPT
jgi:Divergent InlB B-repeat domain